jgi:muramoyltetrapeptide carboxypeptidase LdcA involved in peptidoglycan recycling
MNNISRLKIGDSILPYIDYEELKRNPKIIIGYSDVTANELAKSF